MRRREDREAIYYKVRERGTGKILLILLLEKKKGTLSAEEKKRWLLKIKNTKRNKFQSNRLHSVH